MKEGYWNRAVGGRMLHYVIYCPKTGNGVAACGAQPKNWYRVGAWPPRTTGYGKCWSCLEKLEIDSKEKLL
jgi:hypothetical protein